MAHAKNTLTYDEVAKRFAYNPLTGIFTENGRPAGRMDGDGYCQMFIDGRYYRAHRLAWLYCFAKWPDGDIDHINGCRSDNRISNLRDVPNKVNCENKRSGTTNHSSGLLGVTWCSQTGRWKAQIMTNQRNIHLGRYDDPVEAHKAYLNAKRILHSGCAI